MKTYIVNIEHGVQIRIEYEDVHMELHDSIIRFLDSHEGIQTLKRSQTFETPISEYKYKNIEFSILFDEMADETYAFVDNQYDYKEVEDLLQKFKMQQ